MKIVINTRGQDAYYYEEEILEFLIQKGWKCTTLSEDGKAVPKDKDAYIAVDYVGKLMDVKVNNVFIGDLLRTDKDFIDAIENNLLPCCNHLNVVEIPDGTNYYIDYDGYSECIHEQHRTWQ